MQFLSCLVANLKKKVIITINYTTSKFYKLYLIYVFKVVLTQKSRSINTQVFWIPGFLAYCVNTPLPGPTLFVKSPCCSPSNL